MNDAPSQLTMLTFAPMIDSECTRRVLAFHGVDFTERDRLFGWVSLLTMFHGGYGRVPLVHGRGIHASGPMPTNRYFDALAPSEERLVPTEQPLKSQVEDDFARYNGDLAKDVAAFAYYYLLPERDLMIESFGKPVTSLGRKSLPLVYGGLKWLFALLLRLGEARIEDVRLRIEALLEWTDQRVGDGREFLHGRRPTLADLGLMSAMAPILLPSAYEHRVPPLEKLPQEFRDMVASTRNRPSGRFVDNLYRRLV